MISNWEIRNIVVETKTFENSPIDGSVNNKTIEMTAVLYLTTENILQELLDRLLYDSGD